MWSAELDVVPVRRSQTQTMTQTPSQGTSFSPRVCAFAYRTALFQDLFMAPWHLILLA